MWRRFTDTSASSKREPGASLAQLKADLLRYTRSLQRIGDRDERFVVDFNQLSGIHGGGQAVSDDGNDAFPDISDSSVCQC
jgi:hypothetical protein